MVIILQSSEELSFYNLLWNVTILNWLKSSILKCNFLMNGSVFCFVFGGGDDWGYQKRGVKAYHMAPMSPP
jgi:hypothetical protein